MREEGRRRSWRARERGSRADRGYRGPQDRAQGPYARDRERRTEFRGPELDESIGYASRYPADRPEPDDGDEPHERFEGFGRERPEDHPGYGRAERFGSEAAGYGRQRLAGGEYPERRTHEGRPWQQGERAGIGFPRQGRGTAHPGSSRWVEGGSWDEETESIEEDYPSREQPYRGRPSERIDEWARGSSGRPSRGYAGRGPKNYRRSDERVREDVCECLTRDGDVDASDIEVEVKDGDVVLRGSVPSREMKRRAEDVVLECSGVKEVVNELRVTP